jgi:hypothetical protein
LADLPGLDDRFLRRFVGADVAGLKMREKLLLKLIYIAAPCGGQILQHEFAPGGAD